ncbi:MAG: amidohydrolase family protein [bacterium]
MIVDVHNHYIGDAAKQFLLKEGKSHGIDASEDAEGTLVVDLGFRKLAAGREFFDPQVRLETIQACGIDAQLVTFSASHVFPDKDAGFVAEYLAIANDDVANLAEKHPGKFYPTAVVPLQDIPASVKEAERAVKELNARAIFLWSNVNGAHLDDERFNPLYEAVQDLGVPLIVHPATPVSRHGMDGYHLFNICGFMFDQTLNLARMVLAGVFERFPRLQAFFTHGGGTAPFLRGRWDHAFGAREDTRARIPKPPSAYLGQIWLGTMVFYPPTLEFVIRSVGVDHVCLGSDYPYDMADPDPAGTVRKVSSLSEAEVNAVLGGNAQVLFELHS